jgi:hypothetical protein
VLGHDGESLTRVQIEGWWVKLVVYTLASHLHISISEESYVWTCVTMGPAMHFPRLELPDYVHNIIGRL